MRNWRRNLPSLFAILGIALAALALTYALWQATAAVHQINLERARNTRSACLRQNAQNQALVGFIEQSIPRAKKKDPRVVAYLARARRTWPQTDCAKVVKKQVTT